MARQTGTNAYIVHASQPDHLLLSDDMMAGGLPVGCSLLVSGPSGSGKSQLATAFPEAGARAGEKGVLAAFASSPMRWHKALLSAAARVDWASG